MNFREENLSKIEILFLELTGPRYFQRSRISTQWTIPRHQSTCVFPTSSRSWSNAKPFFRNAEPQKWAPSVWDTHSTGRGTRPVRRHDKCARIVARCTWRVCSALFAHGTLTLMSVAILAQDCCAFARFVLVPRTTLNYSSLYGS